MSTKTITISNYINFQPGDRIVGKGSDGFTVEREMPDLPTKPGSVVEDIDHGMRYFRANGLDYPWVSETATWESDGYVSRLNWRAVPDAPAPTIDPERLAHYRSLAEKQAAAYARMLELDGGVGLLGIREPAMFEDMQAWSNATATSAAPRATSRTHCATPASTT